MMGFGAVWVVLTVVLVVAAVALWTVGGAGTTSGGANRERAYDILRERLAAGDIGQDEYRERATLLGSRRGARRSIGWLPVVSIVVALLAVIVLMISVGGGSGGGWWGPMGARMDDMMGRRAPDGSGPAAIPDAREITVAMTELEFDPATLEVTVGEPVNLTVINRGETFHDLTIRELDVQIGVDGGQSVTSGLEFDDPGEFPYHCSVPGHAAAGMRGTLIVLEPRR